jgi:glutaminyl-tRNA synthetase
MRFNFGLAKRRGGGCIMRFDDTNPEAEKKVYIDSIYESMRWLGHEPVKTTHSSDYFAELYDLAVILIKKKLAYVDHQTKDVCGSVLSRSLHLHTM